MSIQLTCFVDGKDLDLSKFDYKKALSLSSEKWYSDSASVFTIRFDHYDIELTFKKDGTPTHQSLIVYNQSIAKILNVDTIRNYAQTAFEDDGEVVVFLQQNINMHIQKNVNGSFSRIKFITNSTESGNKLIRTIMDELSVDDVINELQESMNKREK